VNEKVTGTSDSAFIGVTMAPAMGMVIISVGNAPASPLLDPLLEPLLDPLLDPLLEPLDPPLLELLLEPPSPPFPPLPLLLLQPKATGTAPSAKTTRERILRILISIPPRRTDAPREA
jgi:hypothetical protein